MAQNKITTSFLLACALLLLHLLPAQAQQKTDSVILNVGKSKIIFLIRDHEDIKSMQEYDLNEILDQLSVKLTGDSTLLRQDGSTMEDTTVVVAQENNETWPEENENNWDDNNQDDHKTRKRPRFGSTRHSINFDIGMNNYLQDGSFPSESNELYAVKPWGSWYVGISSTYSTFIGGPLYLEWAGGVSWYNFKFEDPSVRLTDTPDGVMFSQDTDPDVSFTKSKLTAAYIHASVVPMIDFGRPRNHQSKFWDDWWGSNHNSRGFRIGFGGYVAYRIDSYTKYVIEADDKDKKRNHDDFHLENLRYGMRLQMGFKGTDIFVNYDLNELFTENNEPKLNAFSFGVIL